MTKCPLCGTEYSPQQARLGCRRCPLGAVCGQECCPNCGYQNPREPAWLTLLRKWLTPFARKQRAGAADSSENWVTSLARLNPGESSEIARLAPADDKARLKLLSLGLLPGVRLTLLQRYPCFLLQLGFAQIAIDEELARSIHVQLKQ